MRISLSSKNLDKTDEPMKWLSKYLHGREQDLETILKPVQDKFHNFLNLLEKNGRVLGIISDMEEKVHEEYLFDMNYIRSSLSEVHLGVKEIIESMISLGGAEYTKLRDCYNVIEEEIAQIMPETRPIKEDDLTIPIRGLGRERAYSVGSKNAQLGEMKVKLGLPVPRGFAVTAWAYKRFLDTNKLQIKISRRLRNLDIKRFEDLVRVSEEIQNIILSSPVPEELIEAIEYSHEDLEECTVNERFALRSSAIGEDTQFSFAGQYATFLNISGPELVDHYRKIIASKFTPKAIYYFLSHSLTESELAMSVSCLEMVNARASGVIYTHNPVDPEDECLQICSIYGLGRYLVDGVLSPDVFHVSRNSRELVTAELKRKHIRLVLDPEGGTIEEIVPQNDQLSASITEEQVFQLADYGLLIEEHYGSPQDIEWAIDHIGQVFLLQTRPLRVVEPELAMKTADMSKAEILMKGGDVVCPGAGSGEIFHLQFPLDTGNVPKGSVLVTHHPFPGLVTLMDRISAIVTEAGGVASHMATLAREFGLPTLVGLKSAGKLPQGSTVTVDASGKTVYAGLHPLLIETRQSRKDLFDDMEVIKLLERVLVKISPLNLIDSSASDFNHANCKTFHDITRYCHQLAMKEMCDVAQDYNAEKKYTLRLKTNIPLTVRIIPLDDCLQSKTGKRWVNEDEISSIPMRALWNGIKQQGWPSHAPSSDQKGSLGVMATYVSMSKKSEFKETSYALISKEYMILSLRLGYHFTTIEAMCSEDATKNYVRLQHKGGGATIERRILRVKLLSSILGEMGFENVSKGDYLDARITYQDTERIEKTLQLLGRLIMRTKQLDMALSNEKITQWYADDIMKNLGLKPSGKSNINNAIS